MNTTKSYRGDEVPPDADPALWLELHRLREEDLEGELRQSDYYTRAKRKLREPDKTPTNVVADCLRALRKHTLDTIHKSRSKFVIASLAFHVVISVPAIWKDYAHTSTQEAAAKTGTPNHRPAGPTTLSFVPESGAAGLVKPEASGGIFVDEQFERLCKQRLGRNWNNLSQASIKTMIKSQWEYAYKPSYTGRDVNREFPTNIPVEALGGSDRDDLKLKPHTKDGRIHFSHANIQEVSMRALSSIEALVDS
ncbi:hypothetical protein F5B21DRAFT_505628 [Xylaria acuta]|nr:hypothetical protein F5B21DRAFT_505628 [Xylaria acuta]